MKKFIALFLSVILCFSSVNALAFGLGQEETRIVTLPLSFFEDLTFEEIQIQAAENKEIMSCTQDEEGNIVYEITEKGLEELLTSFKESMDETILGMTEGEEEIASFVSIEYNDTFTQFDVFVDPEKYSPWDSLGALAFYLMGGLYQTLSGIPEEERDVVVNFINNETLEILDSGSLKELSEAN